MRARIIGALALYRHDWLVPDYMFMLTSALILGAWLTLRRCRRYGIPEEDSYQAVFYALLFVFVGGRLIYSLQYWREFSGHFWALLDPTHGGIALYGGMLGLIAGPAVYLRSRGGEVGRYFDASVPALAFGLFLGRIGCFLAGCNWGKVTSLPWGVRFPPPLHAYAQHLKAGLIPRGSALSLPVHPTQLYESLFGLLMFFATAGWLRRAYADQRAKKRFFAAEAQTSQLAVEPRHAAAESDATCRVSTFWLGLGRAKSTPSEYRPGTIFLFSISAYAAFRFSVEFIRADSQGMRLGPITVAQGLSLLIIAGCQFLLWRGRRGSARVVGAGPNGENAEMTVEYGRYPAARRLT